MSSNLKVSVLMLTFNHFKFVSRAIESVLDQKVDFSWELVVGDDASDDGTQEILRSYAEKYPQLVKLVPFEYSNIGMMKNLERTLEVCSGTYIAFLDGDDFWEASDKLQTQADFLDINPNVVATCGGARVFSERRGGYVSVPKLEHREFVLRDLISANYLSTCTVMIRRSRILLTSEMSQLGLGDWPIWIFAARFGPVVQLPKLMATYRVHAAGVWSGSSPMSRLEKIKKMYEFLHAKLDDSGILSAIIEDGCFYSTVSCARAMLRRLMIRDWLLTSMSLVKSVKSVRQFCALANIVNPF